APGGFMFGPPADADCLLVLDMLVPWSTTTYRPGPNVKIITLALDPIHRMTAIYEYPSDLAIAGDAARSVPLLLEELRSQMTPEQQRRCVARLERLTAQGRQRVSSARDAAVAERER